jgi:hypothetical protein
MSEKTSKRWFSTGYMGGVGITAVEPDKHVLKSAVLIRPGEAKGHDMWIDSAFCASVSAAAMAGKFAQTGMKARFGHPNMCSDSLGTFLGRWKNISMREDGAVIGDLYLSSVASESPKGDLRGYIEEMAAKEPDHFGASIVFSRDEEAENEFMQNHCAPESSMGDQAGQRFQSPDPANVKNLPHARCAELHAADLVDEPAATDGMFSGLAGTALAAQVTEWLDLHPEVLTALTDEPMMTEIIARYPERIAPFLARYSTPVQVTPPPQSTTPAEPSADMKAMSAESDAAKSKVQSLTAEVEKFRVELADAIKQRDEMSKALEAAKAERIAALQRIEAIEKGAPPVSACAAPKDDVSPWKKAQLAARKK